MRFTGSRPSSLNVGTFGKAATRWEDATTIGTRRFSLMNGRAEGRLSKTIGTWPATVAVRAGAAPRQGICATKVPVRLLYSSICKWPMPPVPDDAYEYLPGTFLISPAKVL